MTTKIINNLCSRLIILSLFFSVGCTTVPADSEFSDVVSVQNTLPAVANQVGENWHIQEPPRLEFTGRVATAQQLTIWARVNGLNIDLASTPDSKFAQLEASSAVRVCLWLKRFNFDTHYTYAVESRDCDNFARRARAFPDIFKTPVAAQAGVFAIYATMQTPFAGVTDGRHALNVVWTDQGVFVFEPQGLDLVYQRIESWPNKTGIFTALAD